MAKKRANGEGTIYPDKRRGGWIAALIVGIDPKTGKYIRRQRSARTKAEAAEVLTALRLENQQGTKQDFARMPLSDWLSYYLKTYRLPHLAETTRRRMLCEVRGISRLPFARLRLSALSETTMQEGLNSLLDKPTTCRAYGKLLRAAIKKAVEVGAMAKDISHGVKTPRQKRKAIAYITESQLMEILDNCPDLTTAMILRLGFYSGLRPEELCALTWADVDERRGEINVNKAFTCAGSVRIHKATKTQSSNRLVSIPAALCADLRRYRIAQKERLFALGKRNDGDFVFLDRRNNQMAVYVLACRFRTLSRRTGIKLTPRALRHSHATDLFAKGVNAKDIQKRLGHSSIMITMDIYTQFIEERDSEIAALLDSYIVT